MSDVTDILRDRMAEPRGFERMATVSGVAHGVLIAVVLRAPTQWNRTTQAPRNVMTIMLGGAAAGPANGGLTSAAGRPVQAVTPPEEAKRPEPVRPPAAKPPEMTMPDPKARAVRPSSPAPPVKDAPDEARGRTPTRGEQVRPGDAVAETTARGQGFGLSTGGGTGAGSYLDVSNFCCPDYIALMTERIRSNWRPQSEVAGEAVVKFTILRDGRLTDIALERSSGYSALDLTAQRSIYTTRQLPPLPAAFPDQSLTVHLNFQYQR